MDRPTGPELEAFLKLGVLTYGLEACSAMVQAGLGIARSRCGHTYIKDAPTVAPPLHPLPRPHYILFQAQETQMLNVSFDMHLACAEGWRWCAS